eukprot:snap_masked-scaffold_10-processed-gene-10.27-mRNA-1 protein AED:1.00 eAED:1.00 QI:0/-1/0/0/-1/1/1/0/384
MCILDCAWGICVNGTCICDAGFSQSLDFSFFVDNRFDFLDNKTRFSKLPCDQHLDSLRIMYIIAIFFCVLEVLPHCFVIKKLSQIKRLIPFLLASWSGAAGLTYKLLNFQNPRVAYGIDFPFSFILIFSSTCGNLAFLVFIQKYVIWESKMIRSDEKELRTLQRFRKAQGIFLFFVVLTAALNFFLLTNDSKNVALPASLTGYFLIVATLVYVVYGADYFIQCVITSLEHSFRFDLNKDRRHQANRYKKNMKILRFTLLFHGVLLAVANILPLTSFQGLNSMKYFVPIQYIQYALVALTTFFVYNEKKIANFVYDFKIKLSTRILPTSLSSSGNRDINYEVTLGATPAGIIDPDYEFEGLSVNRTLKRFSKWLKGEHYISKLSE